MIYFYAIAMIAYRGTDNWNVYVNSKFNPFFLNF